MGPCIILACYIIYLGLLTGGPLALNCVILLYNAEKCPLSSNCVRQLVHVDVEGRGYHGGRTMLLLI